MCCKTTMVQYKTTLCDMCLNKLATNGLYGLLNVNTGYISVLLGTINNYYCIYYLKVYYKYIPY